MFVLVRYPIETVVGGTVLPEKMVQGWKSFYANRSKLIRLGFNLSKNEANLCGAIETAQKWLTADDPQLVKLVNYLNKHRSISNHIKMSRTYPDIKCKWVIEEYNTKDENPEYWDLYCKYNYVRGIRTERPDDERQRLLKIVYDNN